MSPIAPTTRLLCLLPVVFMLGCRMVYHKGFTYKQNRQPPPANRLQYGGYYIHPFTDSIWYAHQHDRKWQVQTISVRSDSVVNAGIAQNKQSHLLGNILTPAPIYYRREARKGVSVVFFYRDGSFALDAMGYATAGEAEEYYKTAPRDYLYKGYHLQWGRYVLQGDTIKAQYFRYASYGNKAVVENWYLMNQDSGFSLIRVICKWCGDKSNRPKDGIHDITPPEPFSFVPFSEKPDSANWLRHKKWYTK